MARHDSALQGVMLVALLILFPMTIQLLIHQDDSPLWRTVYVEVESEEDDEETIIYDEVDDAEAPSSVSEPESTTHSQPEIGGDLRQELATKAGQVGVMQAAPGKNQGETGWYVDASTELQYWNVGNDGSWTRVQ